MLDIPLVELIKSRPTTPRKTLDDGETEQESVAYIAGSMRVDDDLSGTVVLVLDDTIGDGGTLREVGRALREAGSACVYGLVATKNARGMRGGIDQSKERWS
jgi:adenine/guanine phosphoribosyltransferase-like PRPP-binding protein